MSCWCRDAFVLQSLSLVYLFQCGRYVMIGFNNLLGLGSEYRQSFMNIIKYSEAVFDNGAWNVDL